MKDESQEHNKVEPFPPPSLVFPLTFGASPAPKFESSLLCSNAIIGDFILPQFHLDRTATSADNHDQLHRRKVAAKAIH